MQGLALPIYGFVSRDGRMIGFVHGPLNHGAAESRTVVGNAGIECMASLASTAFDSAKQVIAKSIVMTRRILFLLAFAGYHAILIRELGITMDVSDDSFQFVDDVRRFDMSGAEFRFTMVLYIQRLAASRFDVVFLRALRTMWNARFHNYLVDDFRFAAAVGRMAPLTTGVLFQNNNRNRQFGLSRQFTEEAFVSPTVNSIFSISESEAHNYEDSALRVIRDCVDGDWSEFEPQLPVEGQIPELRAFVHVNDSFNIVEDTTDIARANQNSNLALLVFFGGALRPFTATFIEKHRHEEGIRRSDFMGFFAALDSCAIDRLEGRQAVAEVEGQDAIQQKVADIEPLIQLAKRPHGAEPIQAIYDVAKATQTAFASRNRARIERMTAVDHRESFTTLTRQSVRWIRENSRPAAKAKASPP